MSDATNGCPNKLVPIKVNRIFDSCSDRDCLANIPVIFDTEIPCEMNIVKAKCIKIKDVCIDVEPIPFNKGFFSIDITYTFGVEILAYEKACGEGVLFKGKAYASKSCILYGGESNTRTFFSDKESLGYNSKCCSIVNLPTASVQTVEPIALETRIDVIPYNDECCEPHFHKKRTVVLTLGLFSVVELTRPVTIMVPTYEYTIPKKECCADIDSPCEIFDKIKFPTEEFSPSAIEIEHDCNCNCGFEES